MENVKKYFEKEKPNKEQIIGFKAHKGRMVEIGIFQSFDGSGEVYFPANDDAEQLENIDY